MYGKVTTICMINFISISKSKQLTFKNNIRSCNETKIGHAHCLMGFGPILKRFGSVIELSAVLSDSLYEFGF